MKSRKTKRSFGPISILLAAAPSLATAAFLLACSGAYPAIADDPLVTSDDPYRSVVLPPAIQVPSGSERSDPSSDGGVASDAAKTTDAVANTTDAGGSFDAAADRQATGCVEPEPNENPTTAPVLPLNFTCGRLSDGADVDNFVRTTAAGEQTFRIVSPPGPAGDALMVTIQASGGATAALWRGDTFSLPVGVKCSIQVRSMTATPTSYGILVER